MPLCAATAAASSGEKMVPSPRRILVAPTGTAIPAEGSASRLSGDTRAGGCPESEQAVTAPAQGAGDGPRKDPGKKVPLTAFYL